MSSAGPGAGHGASLGCGLRRPSPGLTLGRDEEGATLISAVSSGVIAPRTLGGLLRGQRVTAEESARARLGKERYHNAVADGAAMTPESAMAYVLAVLDRLGGAAEDPA